MNFLKFLTAFLLIMSTSGRLIGSDIDEYGCNKATGYHWCIESGRCEHPSIVCDQVLHLVSTSENLTIPDYGPIG